MNAGVVNTVTTETPAVSGRSSGGIPVAAGLSHGHASGASRGVKTTGTVLLPCNPASVPVARQRITADLCSAGIVQAAVGDAALVVTELLSNAIRHARPLPGSRLLLAWALENGCVELAVSDGGSATRPHKANASVSSLGGRGLDIVEYLAESWGTRTDDSGLTVWAVLAAPIERIASGVLAAGA
jgi:anti-sigma regulatory factor (Ser/Thr protein kinase)